MFDRKQQTERPKGLVIQTFANDADAERAIRALFDAGFTHDQVSVVSKNEDRAQGVAEDTGADTAEGAGIGALTGGVLGGLAGLFLGATALAIPGIGVVVAGPLAATLAGAGIGGVTGGISGALAGLGVSEDEANQYRKPFEAGHILVVVAAGARESDARRIMANGDVRWNDATYEDTATTDPGIA